MNNKHMQKIIKVFNEHDGFARTKDILETGVHFRNISKLEKEGIIFKIKRGLYKLSDSDFDEYNELVEATKIVDKGVICLLSALDYYDYTTYNPWEYYIAIYRDSKKPIIPEYPPIKIIYFSKKQFEMGINTISINGNEVKIYDKEKTICDCTRYRNKIGMDIFKEAIYAYLNDKDKSINKLLKYADILGVKNVLSDYLEVLL
ncbi:type IV toxin-antitoxin system AbiEi family antitoxin domain-containing protein [Herbivorax sp. ANBcel31]|uniref:type IV toxin-antitoxin system AbiEi family antitoxin domain-containing protein n=1 Tax=Herbivorax sp. ANBcel31 TaxID=3069754 RepID=UPI0027B47B74|nr:type IV toxin-antitoxin system AbiEi family antitoxin domain-containing protein [Herbivorax sp. ANBcel31]MDQ2088177.1 type IV toxin-antitoxin system AbiEi family antitoxin domain-containing protein [Herbivorax sp. ANBcel31]